MGLSIEIKRNDYIGIIGEPFEKEQHPNQQGGLDLYVKCINFDTLNINTVKVYENKKGLYIKCQGTHYLNEITKTSYYIYPSIVDCIA